MSNEHNKGWFKYYHSVCPICGFEKIEKILVKDSPKPDDVFYRHFYMDLEWHCM